jgi:hypothetical protein
METPDRMNILVNKKNIKHISKLVLNHGGMPQLSKLIAHHLRFFGNFNNLNCLDDLLLHRVGINCGLGSRVRKIYISDINRYMRNKHCHRYIRESSDLPKSRAYSEEDLPIEFIYYTSKTEKYLVSDPDYFDLEYNDFKFSEIYILPEPLKKNIAVQRNDITETELLVEIEDEGLDIMLRPEHGVKVYKEDYKNLDDKMLWLEENKERIDLEYAELCIAEFMMKDVNRINRLSLHKMALTQQLEMSIAELELSFGENWHRKELGSFGNVDYERNLNRLVKQIKDMSGIEMSDLDESVVLELEPIHKRLKEIDVELKESKTNYDKTILQGEAARLRLKIREMFSEHAFLSDEIMCRDTTAQTMLNAASYLDKLSRYKSVYEIKPGHPQNLTYHEDNFSPNWPDLSNEKSLRELKATSKRFAERAISEYKNAKYVAVRTMGKRWVELMEKYYPHIHEKNEDWEVEVDLGFERLKEKFIEGLKTENLMDILPNPLVSMRDHLVGLNYIVNRDHSFIKKLPEAFDNNFTKNLAEFKRNLWYMNHESEAAFYLSIRNTRHIPFKDYEGTKTLKEFKDTFLDYKNKNSKLDEDVRSNMKLAVDGGASFLLKGRAKLFSSTAIECLKSLSYVIGDELQLSPVELGLNTGNSYAFSGGEPTPAVKPHYLEKYTYVLKKNYRDVLLENTKIKEEVDKKVHNERIVKDLLEKVKFCPREEALDDDYDIKFEELVASRKKAQDDMVKLSVKVSRKKIQTPSESIFCENRFSILYNDKESVRVAEETANMILSRSENLGILFDWKKYKQAKREAAIIRDNMSEYVTKSDYKKLHNKVAFNNKSNTYNKYRCKDLVSCLRDLFLCYKNFILPDIKFLKEKYGFKRCQLRYMIKNLNSVCRLLNDTLKSARFTNIPFEI